MTTARVRQNTANIPIFGRELLASIDGLGGSRYVVFAKADLANQSSTSGVAIGCTLTLAGAVDSSLSSLLPTSQGGNWETVALNLAIDMLDMPGPFTATFEALGGSDGGRAMNITLTVLEVDDLFVTIGEGPA